ncbi:MAG: hypothetical protein MUF77_08415 [Leptospira sp.]|nr:hypothetical protein [Leptospira sp.]
MKKYDQIVKSTISSFRATQNEILEILKARPIKYFKRIPTGNPKRPYKYFYTQNQFEKFTKLQKAVEDKKENSAAPNLDDQIKQMEEKLKLHRVQNNPEVKNLSEDEWDKKLEALRKEYRDLLRQRSIRDKSHTLNNLEKYEFQQTYDVDPPDKIPVDSTGKMDSNWLQTYVKEKQSEKLEREKKNSEIIDRLKNLGFEIQPESEVKDSIKYSYKDKNSGDETSYYFHPNNPDGDWTWAKGEGKHRFYSYVKDSNIFSQLKALENLNSSNGTKQNDFEKIIENQDILSLLQSRLGTTNPKEVADRLGIYRESDIKDNINYNQKQIEETRSNESLKTKNFDLYRQTLEENLIDLKALQWLSKNNPFKNVNDSSMEEETLFSYADKVKDSVIEKKSELQKQKYEEEVLLKNAYSIGTKLILKSQSFPNSKNTSSPDEEVTIDKVELVDGKLIYHYKDNKFGSGFAPAEEFKSIPTQEEEKISELIRKSDPENRKKVEKTIFGQQISEEENERNLVQDALKFEYTPKEVEVTTFMLGYDTAGTTTAQDYSDMPETALVFWDKKKIDLTKVETPPWFNSINEVEVRRSGYRLLKFPLNTNELTGKYYVYTASGVKIMTAKQVSCVERFFQEKEKAKIGNKSRIKIYKNATMGYTQLDIYKQNLFGYGKKSRLPGSDPKYRELWNLHRKIDEVLGYVATDYELRFKDRVTDGTYQKGEETSYGDSGTVNDLYESFGVKVKMQNGNQVDKASLKEVESGLKEVFQVFGDRSSMAKNFGIKISHAGKKMQHARKALGIYFPSFKAIGVNFIGHEESPNLTLAHEFAHFMDNYIGVREKKSFFASESGTGIESEIANVFRDGMARDFKAKAYWSRSCECFARALECYFNKKTNKPHIHRNGANPEEEYFEEKVAPLVEKFFQEKSEILKSILPSKYSNLAKRKISELRKLPSASPIALNPRA